MINFGRTHSNKKIRKEKKLRSKNIETQILIKAMKIIEVKKRKQRLKTKIKELKNKNQKRKLKNTKINKRN